jgi:polyhydroxyalkanoate synthesis regulator phasin
LAHQFRATGFILRRKTMAVRHDEKAFEALLRSLLEANELQRQRADALSERIDIANQRIRKLENANLRNVGGNRGETV